MTVVENIRWCELLEDTIVTAQHGNDGNRIATATETLQQLTRQFVKVLNERAMLLANSAQFDTALRDAAAIVALLPGSALGYLCMGVVYCQQGHHAAAISIYDQGLEAVPESDAYYQQLHQHRLTAVANSNKRVDFISRLPFDVVVTNIIPRMDQRAYLDPDVLYEPLYVSHTWQERILQQSKGLNFQFCKQVETFIKDHTQLIQFAPYVQTLSGCLLDVHLDDLFSRAHFSNLKELDIFCPHGLTPRLPLIHGLQMIADSLTHLGIYQCPELELRDILETCPNLVSLKTMDVDAGMPLSSSYPKIKLLELHEQREQAHTHEHMVDVLSRFPSLRMLKITPMCTSTVLPILRQHCPYLEAISLRCTSPDFGVTTANDHQDRKGITSAYLGGADFYHQDDLIEFLYMQRESLEILDFHGRLQVNNAFWEISADGRVQPRNTSSHPEKDPLSPSSFTRLVDLRFTSIIPSSSMPMLLWIVLNAPNLNAIHIYNSNFQPSVANAIIKLGHLQKVQIEEDYIMGHTDDNIIDGYYHGIRQFFEHHVALGDHSTLKHVVVHMPFVNAFEQTWLPLLSQLRCLKVLELRGKIAYGDCTLADNCIPIMKRIRRDCPALETLMVNGKVPIWLADS
ncbi:hypothetical protein O0I10_011657 [Lichtheimia ornata]|uniref:Uncharacterized protein n=1 Tax=Lichtheimia ornata TaxID=688661 RepID=A0AAD7UU68_9FUNG|nr:uncharacterized protein O0I10_011657 [Lichtheimia ornata]KAJ8652712.1 hypothetical protein O0I10_011657 [Lichtheimia ornata]